jgi:hypothetical protein
MTQEQWDQIRAIDAVIPVEQWHETYRILFPGESPTSAYYHFATAPAEIIHDLSWQILQQSRPYDNDWFIEQMSGTVARRIDICIQAGTRADRPLPVEGLVLHPAPNLQLVPPNLRLVQDDLQLIQPNLQLLQPNLQYFQPNLQLLQPNPQYLQQDPVSRQDMATYETNLLDDQYINQHGPSF